MRAVFLFRYLSPVWVGGGSLGSKIISNYWSDNKCRQKCNSMNKHHTALASCQKKAQQSKDKDVFISYLPIMTRAKVVHYRTLGTKTNIFMRAIRLAEPATHYILLRFLFTGGGWGKTKGGGTSDIVVSFCQRPRRDGTPLVLPEGFAMADWSHPLRVIRSKIAVHLRFIMSS